MALKMMKANPCAVQLLMSVLCGLGCLGGGSVRAAVTTNVNIVDFAFDPPSVTVNVNDQVKWTWVGSALHSTTSTSGLWDSGLHTPVFAFTNTFGSAGTFNYICSLHLFAGSVTVQAPQGSFSPGKGAYYGLFSDTNGVAQASSGSITLATTAQGKFSGNLQMGGARYSLSGQFDAAGNAMKTVARRSQSSLTVVLQVDLADPNQITGTVSDGTFTAELAADRAVFDGNTNKAPQAGQYNMIIAGSYGSTNEPGGDSYGTVSVDKAGRIRLSGSLADGTRFNQAAVLSGKGQWPLYIPLYSGLGLVLSWVTFTNEPASDLNGALSWIKPAMPASKYYPAGFAVQTAVSGSRYTPPAAGMPVLGFTNATLVLSGGNLAQSITNQITLGPSRMMNLNSNKSSVLFIPSHGSFKGSVIIAPNPKEIVLNGVALQKQDFGSGYFLGSDQSGRVTLAP